MHVDLPAGELLHRRLKKIGLVEGSEEWANEWNRLYNDDAFLGDLVKECASHHIEVKVVDTD